jgi:hypothetical protein
LPFTGFASLPFVLIGLVLSGLGLLMTKVRPKAKSSTPEAPAEAGTTASRDP